MDRGNSIGASALGGSFEWALFGFMPVWKIPRRRASASRQPPPEETLLSSGSGPDLGRVGLLFRGRKRLRAAPSDVALAASVEVRGTHRVARALFSKKI